MMTSFDNNEDKVCLLLKDDVGESRIRSRAKSNDLGSHDHGITIAFLFGVSLKKQFNRQKATLQLGKKPPNLTRERGGKPVLL